MRYTYHHHGQTYTVTVEPQADGRLRVTVGEHVLEIAARLLPDGGLRLLLDGQSHIAYTAAHDDRRYVQVDGADYTLNLPATTRRKSRTSGDSLTAQMPGQVTAVLAQAGDTVARGQTLLILEAMKMETRVAAPADGRLVKLLVAAGDIVERGQRLADFEAQSAT